MKKRFFSVVIPLYNKEHSVKRAVMSVLSQTYTYFELIIVDDGSTDCSAEIVSRFNDPRLRLIRQDNRGPSAARNAGCRKAEADYVCFLDADDKWDLSFLSTMCSLIDVAPLASLYSVKYRVADELGDIFHHRLNFPKDYLGYVENFYRSYKKRGLINSSSVCIRSKSLHEIGGFPEQARLGEDIYTWLRLADINRVAYANVERVTIYRNAENRSGVGARQEIPYHIKAVLGGGAKEFSKENQNTVTNFVAKNAILHAAGAVLNGDRRTAFLITRMLLRVSLRYSSQVLCVVIMPRILLRMIKSLRKSL